MSFPLVAVRNDQFMAEESRVLNQMRGFDTAVKSFVNLAIAGKVFRWNEFPIPGQVLWNEARQCLGNSVAVHGRHGCQDSLA